LMAGLYPEEEGAVVQGQREVGGQELIVT